MIENGKKTAIDYKNDIQSNSAQENIFRNVVAVYCLFFMSVFF